MILPTKHPILLYVWHEASLCNILTRWQLRSGSNDLILYQPYHSSVPGKSDATLHFLKIPNPQFTKTSLPSLYDDEVEDDRREPMRAINDLDGYSTIFLPGQAPTFILKSASSPPQLVNMREKPIQCLTRLNISQCERGFAYVDQRVRRAQS